MAINNFKGVHIDTNGKLIVSGTTITADGASTNAGPGAAIRVVVMAVKDLDKSCEPKVDDASTSPWSATTATHPFSDGEEVWVVGRQTAPNQDAFLWGDGFRVGDPDRK